MFCSHMSVHFMCASCMWRSEGSIKSPGTGVLDNYQPLLTAEPSLQPPGGSSIRLF